MNKVVLSLLLVAAVAGGTYYLFFSKDRNAHTSAEKSKETPEAPVFTPDDTLPFGDPPDEEELERTKMLKEHARPAEFVKVDFAHRRNILGETVVEGTLVNQAELTTYRDLQLVLYFDNAEGVAMDSASEVVFETIMPQKQTTFRLKQKGPRKAKDVRLRLHNALVVEEY